MFLIVLLSFLKKITFILYVRIFCLHVYKCIICGPGVSRSQRKVSDLLELKLIDGCSQTASTLDHGATSPASVLTVKKVKQRDKATLTRACSLQGGCCEGIQLSTSGANASRSG